MKSGEPTKKPGEGFAFKPRNTLSCPSPSSHPRDTSTASAIMVKERAPPKGPSPLQPAPPARANESQRETTPDDDFDITAAVRDFSSIKGKYRGAASSAPTSQPTFGHPTKMASSRKQKADIFIHQKSRPEHHLGTRISGPQPPTYHDRRPPPMPTFSSNAPGAVPSFQDDAVFYTDPTKANADLKALLEGGLDEEEGQDDAEGPVAKPDAGRNPETTESPPEKLEQKKDVVVGKDGTVDGLKVKLLPHQVEGVNWMRGRELGPVKRGTVPKGGLLADDMGLGKTLQTISLMLKNQKPSSDDKAWKKHFAGLEKTTLVVAPLALIRQWEHEMRDKVAKSHALKVLVHHGPQRTKNSKDLALYDVVITTYQILVSEHGKSSDVKGAGCFGLHWWRVVLDEAHTVKNRNAKATKACYALRSEYRWCLSGTPMQNNLDELQSLIKFLRIRPYDDLKQWKEHIDLPLKNGKGHIAIRRLHSILRCFMKRRTKEILKETGALHPGGEAPADGAASATDFRHTERNVVTISAKLAPAERNFYKRLEERADKSMEVMMKNKLSYANAFTLLLRLRQACNHPKLVEGKLDKDRDAMSIGTSQKKRDADVDAMAEMFAGMGIESKSCSICGKDLTSVDVETGRENCSDCRDDLEYFKDNGRPEKEEKKKKRKSRKQASPLKAETDAGERKSKAREGEEGEEHVEPAAEVQQRKPQRRQRNRNAIVDSDDEEEEPEGSWLVPEGERGDLHLGKAGGEEDENADGGGDWIGSEDSADDTADTQDHSNLSSFVVDDETAQKEPCYASGDEDSLLSISAITQKMAAQTLDEVRPATSNASTDCANAEASGSEGDETEVYSSGSDSHSNSEDELDSPGETPLFASAKIREITRLLHAEAHEHKFIVFSQFTSMLDLVEPFLRKARFCFRRYDGSMKNDEREESLRRLREDKSVRVLLCSLKCGSLGLNLTAVTRVIIVEPFWNPVSPCRPRLGRGGSHVRGGRRALTPPCSLSRNRP